MSLLVLFDLSVAFDTVIHGVLLGRLSQLGISGLDLAWLWSFLVDRSQRVQLGEMVSTLWTLWTLNYGVPQGSLLSPMLFNIYMRPLGEVSRSLGALCHKLVDSTQFYLSFHPSAEDASPFLGCCLDAVLG